MIGKRTKLPLRMLLVCGGLGLVLLAGAGVTAARYVMQNRQSGVMTAEEFYFTSDLLREPSETALYYIDPKAETFSFRLFNYADSQRTTPQAIEYQIAVSGAATAGPDAGSIAGGAAGESVITITPSWVSATDGNPADITVTAKSTSPYKKTLQAVFKRSLGNEYTVNDGAGNTAAVLTVTCADSGGVIKISLPSVVIADQADDRITYADGVYTFTAPGSGVYSVVLLKTEVSGDYSCEGNFADAITIP